ncbi:MAG: hypothetical protein MRK01_13375 [Candidatus Scalindua sp.]|nr:hypothetical protein [Candidatus Scalindua sp.]
MKDINTNLVFGFTRFRQNEYHPPVPVRAGAGERLTGRAGCKPDLGEGIPGQKAPRILLAQFYIGFYLSMCVPYAQAGQKTL